MLSNVPRGITQADEPDLSAAPGLERQHPDTLEVLWKPEPPFKPAGAPGPGASAFDTGPGKDAAPAADATPAIPAIPATPGAGTDPAAEPAVQPALEPAPEAITATAAKSAPEELRELLHDLRIEHRRRRSVRYGRILTAAVALALLGAWLLKPPIPGGNENRAQTAFPKLDASGVADASAFRQTDSALRDRFALREYVVSAIGDAAKNKLGVSLSPQVVLGDGGTPFTAEDFTLPCQSAFDVGQINTDLENLRTLGAKNGRTLTVAVAPDKSSILTGQLGRFGKQLMSCSNRVRESTQQQWGSSETSPVLTLWNQMQAVENAEPGQAYQHGDTHWTSRGSLVFAQALITKLIAQGEAPSSLAGQPVATRGPDQLGDADLYRMMGTPRQEVVPTWLVHREGLKITSKDLTSHYGYGIQIYHSVAQAGATVPLIKGKTLIIHDSFFSRAEPQVAPYFSSLVVMHWADFVYAAQQGTLPSFDRIIFETVQRGWPQRADWLAPGQPVYTALEAALSAPRGKTKSVSAAAG